MKIIHIIGNLAQGGAESQLERIIIHSLSSEVEHIVISLKNDETPLLKRLRYCGVQVYCAGFNGWRTVFGFYKLRNILSILNSPSSVIQCWMYHANFFGLLAAWSLGVTNQVVWNIRRTALPGGVTGFLATICAKLSHRIPVKIVCCAEAAKISHMVAGYCENNMVVIHNGIDTDLFTPDENMRNKFRQNAGIAQDEFVIGTVGRYAPVKGHIYLLQALQCLLDEGYDKYRNIKIVLVGRGIESADKLKPLLSLPEIKKHIIIMEEQPDIWNVMPAFDLLCMPSESEGFPNVVAEAMSCGVPAVVTDVGDAAIIVGMPQMIAQPYQPLSIANSISEFYKLSSDERGSLSVKVRKSVCTRFSVDTAWKKYCEIYNQVIESE